MFNTNPILKREFFSIKYELDRLTKLLNEEKDLDKFLELSNKHADQWKKYVEILNLISKKLINKNQ